MTDGVFRLVLPGGDAKRPRPKLIIVDRDMDVPKIDTSADPEHAGIIFLNWESTGITMPINTFRILDKFPHDLNQIPTVVASYKFENGSVSLKGTLPFQYGALGVITMDTDDENINLKYESFDANIPGTAIPPFLLQLHYYVMSNAGY